MDDMKWKVVTQFPSQKEEINNETMERSAKFCIANHKMIAENM